MLLGDSGDVHAQLQPLMQKTLGQNFECMPGVQFKRVVAGA